MKNAVLSSILVFFIFGIAGCGLSEEDISETVKMSMQETMDSDPNFKDQKMVIQDVQVVKKGDNAYKGIATIMHQGSAHDIMVDIFVDGQNVMWEAPRGSFMFLAQKQLQNLIQ